MKDFFVKLILLFTVSGLVSCSEEGMNSSSTAALGAFSSRIQGRWRSPCEDLSANGDPNIKGQRREYYFTSAYAYFYYRYYEEPTCVTANSTYEMRFTYAIGQAIAHGHHLNLTLDQILITPLTNAVKDDYTNRAICGVAPWFTYNPIGITGLGCDTLLNNFIPARNAGTVTYTVLKIDRFLMLLYAGDSSDGSGLSEATRSTAYESRSYSNY